MKYLFFAAILLLTSTFASAQKVAGPQSEKPAADKPTTPKRVEPSFPREKFDPMRDPAADLAAAVATAAKSGRRVILDVGGEWCGWCVYMDRFFYDNPEITKLRDDNFVWLKVNFSEQNENKAFLGQFPPTAGYPHLYVLDETGKLLLSEDTTPLEATKGYDRIAVIKFLKEWAPKKSVMDTK